jgi:hypothetical protein
MSTSTSARLAGVTLLAVAALALTGCVPQAAPTSSPGTISTPTDSPTATVPPAPKPSKGTAAQPVSIACSDLVSAQTMYDFNPNFTLQADYAPQSGTAAYTAKADGGVACTWVNETSNDTITISAARPGSTEFAALKTSAATGTPVAGYGDAAYFSGDRFDVFSGAYWVVATSDYFSTANDASSLMKEALGHLG